MNHQRRHSVAFDPRVKAHTNNLKQGSVEEEYKSNISAGRGLDHLTSVERDRTN